MNVWSKLLTALRGGANEMGEAMVDSQALRILDQEIRDADLELRKSKEALAEIMAKQKLAADRAEEERGQGHRIRAVRAQGPGGRQRGTGPGSGGEDRQPGSRACRRA